MRTEQKQYRTTRLRKDFDYNNPTRKCVICYTLSSWHCYECNTDFCEKHFHDDSHRKMCRLQHSSSRFKRMQIVLQPRGLMYRSDDHFATVYACYDSKHQYLDLFLLSYCQQFLQLSYFMRSLQKWQVMTDIDIFRTIQK